MNNEFTMSEGDILMSPSIGALASALCEFQKELTGVAKNSSNPFYGSKYADLAAIWQTIREPLTKNGLSLVQMPCSSDPKVAKMTTLLIHTSGEFMGSSFSLALLKDKKGVGLVEQHDPQTVGSAITYARRYGIVSILGIHQEDDDANKYAHKPTPDDFTRIAATVRGLLDTRLLTEKKDKELRQMFDIACEADDVAALKEMQVTLKQMTEVKNLALLSPNDIDTTIENVLNALYGADNAVAKSNSLAKHADDDRVDYLRHIRFRLAEKLEKSAAKTKPDKVGANREMPRTGEA